METIYRQLAPHKLSKEQFKDKLQKDSEYEIAVQNLTISWKKSEITHEQYKEQKSILWNTYRGWAISQGLYEEVTPDRQLQEAANDLDVQLQRVNQIRTELGHKELKVV